MPTISLENPLVAGTRWRGAGRLKQPFKLVKKKDKHLLLAFNTRGVTSAYDRDGKLKFRTKAVAGTDAFFFDSAINRIAMGQENGRISVFNLLGKGLRFQSRSRAQKQGKFCLCRLYRRPAKRLYPPTRHLADPPLL